MPFETTFETWKAQVKHSDTAEFEKYLFVNIACVLFGGKDGELLTLPREQLGLNGPEQLACVGKLAAQWGYQWHVMCENEQSLKLVIYNRQKVQAALSSVQPCHLCAGLNYRPGLTAEEFLAEVARRWQASGDIPHEIGLALGYPVKDVLGFMGLLKLECTGMCGWRIYGDPKPSMQRSQQFLDAQRQAMRFVAV